MKTKPASSVDDFIDCYPSDVQAILQKLRRVILEAAPEAQEKISYGIPTFTFHGNLVHFSAYKTHIGFYPGSSAIHAFADELKPYETSKGTVRFPLGKPLPFPLIRKIVQYRVKANLTQKK